MSDLKTVTHEGKVYQIGGIYEFSDSGDYWTIDELLSIEGTVGYPFKVKDCEWSLIREAKSKIGTITHAPIELVNHNAYMFNIKGDEVIGLYCSDTETLTGGRYCLHYLAVSNIRLMTVEEK
jgi:hypothetical protein